MTYRSDEAVTNELNAKNICDTLIIVTTGPNDNILFSSSDFQNALATAP